MNKTAIVKWFNDASGYGFAIMDDGREVFCHHTEIKMDGFRTLKPGEAITFHLYEDKNKRLVAKNIRAAE